MKSKQNTKNPAQESQDIFMNWSAPNVIRYEKEAPYMKFLLMVWVLLLAYSLWTGVWSFSVLLVSMMAVFVAEHYQKIVMLPVELGSEGLRYGKHFFHYHDMKTFWILNENEAYQELHFQLKSGLTNHVMIYLPKETHVALLRRLMAQYVHESEGKKRFLTDHLVHFLRLR